MSNGKELEQIAMAEFLRSSQLGIHATLAEIRAALLQGIDPELVPVDPRRPKGEQFRLGGTAAITSPERLDSISRFIFEKLQEGQKNRPFSSIEVSQEAPQEALAPQEGTQAQRQAQENGDRPFAHIQVGGRAPTPPAQDFSDIVVPTSPTEPLFGPDTGPRRFAKGVAREITAPARLFGGEPVFEGEELGVAGFSGEMAGLLVSFYPFLKAGQVFTKGVGLAKLSPRAAVITGDALGFGAFEAATAPEGERAKRAAIGLAIGAGGGALLGLSKAHRAAYGGEKAAVEAVGVDIGIDPLVLSLERGVVPDLTTEHGVEEALKMAQTLVEEGVGGLPQVAVRFARRNRAGNVIVPVLTQDTRRAVATIRAEWPEVRWAVTRDEVAPGIKNILFTKPTTTSEMLIATLESAGVPATSIRKVKKLIPKFMGEGEALKYEDVVEILNTLPKREITKGRPGFIETKDVTFEHPTVSGTQEGAFDPTELYNQVRAGLHGNLVLPPAEALPAQATAIWIAGGAANRTSNVIHEYTHFLGVARYWKWLTQTGLPLGRFTQRSYGLEEFIGADLLTLRGIYSRLQKEGKGIFREGQRPFAFTGRDIREAGAGGTPFSGTESIISKGKEVGVRPLAATERRPFADAVTINAFETELKHITDNLTRIQLNKPTMTHSTTLEIIKDLGLKQGKLSLDETRKVIRAIDTSFGEPYYYTSKELIARGVELMFVNPKLAKEVAPGAFEMLRRIIIKDSSAMQAMLTRNEQRVIEKLIRMRASSGQPQLLLEGVTSSVSQAQLDQFVTQGIYKGMRVFVEGRPQEALFVSEGPAPLTIRRRGGIREKISIKDRPERGRFPSRFAAGDMTTLRDPRTGKVYRVNSSKVTKPLFSETVARQSKSLARIRAAMERPLETIGLKFEDPATGGLIKAAAQVGGYETHNGSFESWWGLFNKPGTFAEMAPTPSLRMGRVLEILDNRNMPGLLINDEGAIKLIGRDPRTFTSTGETLVNPEFTEFATQGTLSVGRRDPFTQKMVRDGKVSLQWNDRIGSEMDIPFRDVAESIARANGAIERDVPYIVKLIEEETAKKWDRLIDPRTVKQADEMVAKAIEVAVDDFETAASRMGLKGEINTNGEYVVMSRDGEKLAKFVKEEDAREYLSRTGVDEAVGFVDSNAVPTALADRAGVGGQRAPFPGEQMDKESVLKAFAGVGDGITTHAIKGQTAREAIREVPRSSRLVTAFATNMEDWSKAAEGWLAREGFNLKPHRRIYLPLENVILDIERRYANVRNVILQNRTFSEQMELLDVKTRAAAKGLRGHEAKEAVRNATRATSILSKSEVETEMAKLLGRPMSVAELEAAKGFSKAGFAENIPEFYRWDKTIARDLAKDKTLTFEGQLEQLAWGENKKRAFRAFNAVRKQAESTKTGFEPVAVYRHAIAGGDREAWMAERGFNKAQRDLVEEIQRTHEASYTEMDLEARPLVAGLMPALEAFSRSNTSAIMKDPAFKQFGKAMEWLAPGVRSGEMRLYYLDPVRQPYKHWRNLQMRKHFDPLLPDVFKELDAIQKVDPRTYRIMNEFRRELQGIPHQSFTRIQDAFTAAARNLGFDLEGTEVRRSIDIMTYLVYGATIPFRPALIARNYFQLWQMIAPRVNHRWFNEGLKRARSPGGFQAAVNALALTTTTPPVAFGERAVSREIRGLPFGLRKMVDRGFDWYRKADDYGRAVAFHSLRARMERHWGDRLAGRISYDEFKKRAKVLTFSEQDIEIFDALVRGGKLPADIALIAQNVPGTGIEAGKNYLGRIFANETIFRYGHANHPAGWGSAYGRLFGQFGTWPIQYKDFLLNGMTRGTTADKWAFATTHTGINAAVVGGGAGVGLNMWSWVSFPSLQYTGGPLVDMGMDVMNIVSGSPQERRMALKSLNRVFPTLSDPSSIFLPGSYALKDAWRGLQGGVGVETFPRMLGFRFYDPGDDTILDTLLPGR